MRHTAHALLATFLLLIALPVRAEPPSENPAASTPLNSEELRQYQALSRSIGEWRLYQELSRRIKANAIDPIDDKQLLNGCLNGAARELDAHSAYLPPVELKGAPGDVEHFAGTGLTLGIKNNRPVVIAAIEGSPAAQADIRRGDILARIDGEIVLDLSLDEVIKRLRGKPGSTVRIGLQRGDAPDITEHALKRALITNKSVKSRRLEPGYAYLQINAIQRDTPQDLAKAARAFYSDTQTNIRGLVLDLRDNPGGLMDRSLALAAIFLPKNALLLTSKGQSEHSAMQWRATQDALGGLFHRLSQETPAELKDVPLVVLVNGGTAAGAEIIAGALQDHQRAVVIGSTTFGKDSLQQIFPLSNEGAAKLTVERWRTPKGRSAAPGGLVPDVTVSGSAADPDRVNDKALSKALAVLKAKTNTTARPQAGSNN